MSHLRFVIGVVFLWACAACSHAQLTTTVRGRVEVAGAAVTGAAVKGKTRPAPLPGTVVWLTPIGGSADEGALRPQPVTAPLRLVQKNKSFDPHILVVPAGSMVEFPNHDPFFHNVFSLFEGKRFDLGLYEAGTSRMVRFDRPGISYIFCNIHPEMSAIVITITTRLYTIANPDGQLSLADVPYGRYVLHVWSEGMGAENTQPQTREISITESSSSLGVIKIPQINGQPMAHKNKYGRDYDAPVPNSSVYEQH